MPLHIIHSTIRKWLINSRPESEEKQRLLSTIESKLKIEFTLAQLRQETEDNVVAIVALQCGTDKFPQQLPSIEDLVDMAMVISKKALHEFLLTKWREQTIEFTKKFKFRGNAPKINKLKAKLTRVIDKGRCSEEILDIKSQMRELVDEDVMSALKKQEKLQHSWGWETKQSVPKSWECKKGLYLGYTNYDT